MPFGSIDMVLLKIYNLKNIPIIIDKTIKIIKIAFCLFIVIIIFILNKLF